MRWSLRRVAVTLALAGAACRGASPPAAKTATVEHEHHAPHHGQLVELGDEFAHVELVLDRKAGTLTAYVLDGEAEQSVRIAQPSLTLRCTAPLSLSAKPVVLVASDNVLTGEKPGDASEFSVVDPALRDLLQLEGRIESVSVKGRTFSDVLFRAVASQ
jgi:hypothetical protein